MALREKPVDSTATIARAMRDERFLYGRLWRSRVKRRLRRTLGNGPAVLPMGLVLCVLWVFADEHHMTANPPREYYPVATFRTKLLLAPDAVYLLPTGEPGDPTPEPAVSSTVRRESTEIWAEVTVERPVPLRKVRSGRSYRFEGYRGNFRTPGPDELARAGAERAVILSLLAFDGTLRTRLWPHTPDVTMFDPLPDEVALRALPMLAAEVQAQSGDLSVADAVRAGGEDYQPLTLTPRPVWISLLGWGGLFLIAGGIFMVIATVFTQERRPPA